MSTLSFSNFIEKYPIEIALFAAKHEYAELLKLTADHAVKLPLSTVVPLLPERLVLPWASPVNVSFQMNMT